MTEQFAFGNHPAHLLRSGTLLCYVREFAIQQQTDEFSGIYPPQQDAISRAVTLQLDLPRSRDMTLVHSMHLQSTLPNPKTLKPLVDFHEPWATACRRAGLKDVRIHDLRHTFASNLVNAGHSLFVVSRALGHASVVQTARYSHLADDTLLAAADAAANAMGDTWSDLKKSSAQA